MGPDFTFARIAYEAYREAMLLRQLDDTIKDWSALTDAEQMVWDDVADATLRVYAASVLG